MFPSVLLRHPLSPPSVLALPLSGLPLISGSSSSRPCLHSTHAPSCPVSAGLSVLFQLTELSAETGWNLDLPPCWGCTLQNAVDIPRAVLTHGGRGIVWPSFIHSFSQSCTHEFTQQIFMTLAMCQALFQKRGRGPLSR